MWEIIWAQIKYNLEMIKLINECSLRIVNRELENIENDLKYKKD
jgi:hypothetical protein